MAADIMNHDGKCVVFLYSRSSLDVVGRALETASIPHPYVRIDGMMNKAGREQALKAVRNRPYRGKPRMPAGTAVEPFHGGAGIK